MPTIKDLCSDYVDQTIKNGLLSGVSEVKDLMEMLKKLDDGVIDESVKKEAHSLFTKLTKGGVFKECKDAKLAMDVWNIIMTHKEKEETKQPEKSDEGSSS